MFGGPSKEHEFVGFEEHVVHPKNMNLLNSKDTYLVHSKNTIDVLSLDESGRRLLDKVLCAAKSKYVALL